MDRDTIPYPLQASKKIANANKDLFKWGKLTAAPLFYHRGSAQIPGPVWKDNKCALDSILVSLLAIRINMKENPLFSNGRGSLLMMQELPVLTDLIDKFLVADISNIEFTATAWDIFYHFAIREPNWIANRFFSVDSIFEYTVKQLRITTISNADCDVSRDQLIRNSTQRKTSFMDHQFQYSFRCSSCRKAIKTCVDTDYQLWFPLDIDVDSDVAKKYTHLSEYLNHYYYHIRKNHHLVRLQRKMKCCDGDNFDCEVSSLLIPEVYVVQFIADGNVSTCICVVHGI